MNSSLRIAASAALAALAFGACAANAQGYPSKPVRVIVTFPAGGVVDLIARAVTDKLAATWRQPVLVEPRPGASGNIGAQLARNAPPDGYTFMMAGIFLVVNPALDPNSRFKPADFAGAALVGTTPNLFVVPGALPVSSLGEFVEYARARPGKLNAGHPGTGSFSHLCTLLFAGSADIDLTTVSYKGQPQAVLDLLSGQLSFMVLTNTFAIPHVKAGKLKALAVNAASRLAQLPDVPTVVEAGFPAEITADQWFGFVAPAGTPREVIRLFNAEVGKALESPEVIDRLEKLGVVVAGGSPEQFDALLRAETGRWARVIKERGLRAD